MVKKTEVISFCWQHVWLLVSLYIMTLGIAFCVRSLLGSSVISVLPFVFSSAGAAHLGVPGFTIGQYTYIMNIVLVVGQIMVLRRQFEWAQLFQLVVGFIFGSFLDVNMWVTQWVLPVDFWQKALSQVAGCTILGTGISLEVRCGSVTMPGEGFPVALSKVTDVEFPKMKIMVDISLVILGVIACFCFFGSWQWQIVGIGTLFAMVYVGMVVRFVSRRLGWFDRILGYQPGFRRYIYGLLRFIRK